MDKKEQNPQSPKTLSQLISEKAFPQQDYFTTKAQVQQKAPKDPDQIVGFFGGMEYGSVIGTWVRNQIDSIDPWGFFKPDYQPTDSQLMDIAREVGYDKNAVGAVLFGLKDPRDIPARIKNIKQNKMYQRLAGEAGFLDSLASEVASAVYDPINLATMAVTGGSSLALQVGSGVVSNVASGQLRQAVVGTQTDPLMDAAVGGGMAAFGHVASRWLGDTMQRSRVIQYSRKHGTQVDQKFLKGKWGSQTVAQAVDDVRQAVEQKLPNITVKGALSNPHTKGLQEFVDKTFRAQGSVKKVLNPDGTYTHVQVGSKTQTAQEHLRDLNNELWEVRTKISDSVQNLKAAGWSDDQIRMAVYEFAQTGTFPGKSDQNVQAIATIAKGFFDARWTQMNQRGLIESKLDNYFPVMIDEQRRNDFINSCPGATPQQRQQNAINKLADNFLRSIQDPKDLQHFKSIFRDEVLDPLVAGNNARIDKAVARAEKSATRKKEDLQKKGKAQQQKAQKKQDQDIADAQRSIKSSERNLDKVKKASQRTMNKQLNAIDKQQLKQTGNFVSQLETLQKQATKDVQQARADTRTKLTQLQQKAQTSKKGLRQDWKKSQQTRNGALKELKAKDKAQKERIEQTFKKAMARAQAKKTPEAKNAAKVSAQNRHKASLAKLKKRTAQKRSSINKQAQDRAAKIKKKQGAIDDTLNRESLRQKGLLDQRIKTLQDILQKSKAKLQSRADKMTDSFNKRRSNARSAHVSRSFKAQDAHKANVDRINQRFNTKIQKSQTTAQQRATKALEKLKEIDDQLATRIMRILQDHPDLTQEQIEDLFQQWLRKYARDTAVGWIDAGKSIQRGLMQGHDPTSKLNRRRAPFRYNMKDSDGFSPNTLRADIQDAVDYYGRRSGGDIIVHDSYGFNSYDQASKGFRKIALEEAQNNGNANQMQQQKAMLYLLNRLYGKATAQTHRQLGLTDALADALRQITFMGANGFMGVLNYTEVAQGVRAYGAMFVLQSIPKVGPMLSRWSKGLINMQDRTMIQGILFGQEVKALRLFSDIRRNQQRRYYSSSSNKFNRGLANIVAGLEYVSNKLPSTRFLQDSQASIVSTVQAKMLDDLIRMAYGGQAKGKIFFSQKALQRLSIDDAQMNELFDFLRGAFTYTKDGAKLKDLDALKANPNALNTLRRLGDYCADEVILRPGLADGFFKWDANSNGLRDLLLQFKSFALRSYQKRLVKSMHRAAQGQEWSQAASTAISLALATIGNFGITSIRTIGMDEEQKEKFWRNSFGVGSLQQLVDDPYKLMNVMAINSLRTGTFSSVSLAANMFFGSQSRTTSSTEGGSQALGYVSSESVTNMLPSFRMGSNLINAAVIAPLNIATSDDDQEKQKAQKRLQSSLKSLLPNWLPFRQTIKQALTPQPQYFK